MIMFVTYDFSDQSSGSRVRPMKMYHAFKKLGYDVFLLSGDKQEKENDFQRLKKTNERFDFCYIEPSSYPMQPIIDYKIISYIKKRNIPIGIFYRDAYWKFYNKFLIKGFKNLELKIRYQIDLQFFKWVSSIMFFPSDEMANYFTFKQPKFSLPPAADIKNITLKGEEIGTIPTAIYVGGISKRYGTDMLLNTFNRINKERIRIKLILVCRNREYTENAKFFSGIEREGWLEIKHVQGELLESEYTDADFGIIPIEKDEYNDFAVPVKLFEYLSYGLPILSTNCTVLEKYISTYNLGIVEEDNEISFAKGIEYMISNYDQYRADVISFVNTEGLWDHRAEKVIKLLSKYY